MTNYLYLPRSPNPISMTSSSPVEAVERLCQAARLCLDGVRTLAFENPQQQQMADKLIKDAMVFHELALQRKHYPPPPSEPDVSLNASTLLEPETLPPWDQLFAGELNNGGRCARYWLERSANLSLWWQLTQTRQGYPEGERRTAFEAGFLRRVQHRLLSLQYPLPRPTQR